MFKIIASKLFLLSTTSRFFLSSSAYCSASLTALLISSSLRFVEAVIVIFCSLFVPRSFALTFTIPLASISKVTSICGTPLGAGGIPVNWKRPSDLFWAANSRSPWRTLISTPGWLSCAVLKIWDFFVGIVVFLEISFVQTPPNVSIPSESGVTSSNNTSLTSPPNTPAWIAAPIATHSSGLIPLNGVTGISFESASTTQGTRVEPPTKTTFEISVLDRPASFNAFLVQTKVSSTRSLIILSNFARVKVYSRCFGPVASAVMNGKLIVVCVKVLSSIFAFSAASFKRCFANLSLVKSIPVSFLNSSISKSIIRLSKSSPPRRVLPLVDKTSNTPSPISRIETSNVPPPRSYTNIFWFFLSCLSRPYASAAAVGSLIIRKTSRPAILPAFLVAWRWESLKYAGTVITAWVTGEPRYASASCLSFVKIIALISSGLYDLSSILTL